MYGIYRCDGELRSPTINLSVESPTLVHHFAAQSVGDFVGVLFQNRAKKRSMEHKAPIRRARLRSQGRATYRNPENLVTY